MLKIIDLTKTLKQILHPPHELNFSFKSDRNSLFLFDSSTPKWHFSKRISWVTLLQFEFYRAIKLLRSTFINKGKRRKLKN